MRIAYEASSFKKAALFLFLFLVGHVPNLQNIFFFLKRVKLKGPIKNDPLLENHQVQLEDISEISIDYSTSMGRGGGKKTDGGYFSPSG